MSLLVIARQSIKYVLRNAAIRRSQVIACSSDLLICLVEMGDCKKVEPIA